jgi:AraC-like DNA-binding protein
MPIYMDRHDLSETVNAEHIAQLHQEDLKVQHQFGCRGLTYWFDGKRQTAFCLIEAPNADALREMHNRAHGQIPHQVIEVDPGIVESFLGRIEDPEKAQNTVLNIINDPAFRTIMVISLQRSSLIRNDPDGVPDPLRDYHNTVLNLVNLHKGNPVKHAEDYFLISFESVSKAVQAAFAIQSNFKEIRKSFKNNTILLKIGLNAGVPVTDKRSIFQDTIKLAERMCKVAKGEIVVSSEIRELYNSENPTPLREVKSIYVLSQAEEQFLTLLMDYTESAWSDVNVKVDDFSKPVGCSKSQFYRKMIQLTGKSPNVFIREYRLHEALTLLNRNAGNISEIAFETGFSSPSYFSKCFQKRYGNLPSDQLSPPLG